MATPTLSLLPMELMQRIMQESLAGSITEYGLPQPIPDEPPLVFTRVSRTWRNISLNTPELWQAIRVDSDTQTVPAQVLSLWSSRAANRPRSIQLEEGDDERAAALLVASMESCEKWQDIELRLTLDSFAALVTYNRPFPMLLELAMHPDTGVWEDGRNINVPVAAPLLRKVTLRDFPFVSVDTAWNQLTTLDMITRDDLASMSVLRRCITLSDLHYLALMVPEVLTPSPFPLPSLRSLRTTGQSLLPFITVPSLTRLDIWGPGLNGEMGKLANDLRALLERSVCPLTHLLFRVPAAPDITTTQFQTFLETVPSVVDLKLTFHFGGVLEKFSAVLLQVADILPKFTMLHIMYRAKEEESFDPLLDALHSRRKPIGKRASLQAFHLEVESPAVLRPTVRAQLLALKNEDMDIGITSH